jgi:hypothetical protein
MDDVHASPCEPLLDEAVDRLGCTDGVNGSAKDQWTLTQSGRSTVWRRSKTLSAAQPNRRIEGLHPFRVQDVAAGSVMPRGPMAS